ncbi:MAG: acyl-CoA dehydrogenase family protein [Candidatus Bathyarchaeia archaeon]
MPIDFGFTEEQELFRRTLKDYFAKNLTPKAKEILKARMITPDVHKAIVSQGLLCLLLPKEFGGSEADYVTFIIAVEELTKADPTGVAGIPIWYGASCSRMLAVYGTAELKEEILPKVVKDGWITPLHNTEPGCGTDFTAITTTAKKNNGDYIVNGEKQILSCVSEAQKYGGGFITSVKTRPELGSKGLSLIYIPVTSNGITTSIFEGMGIDLGGVRYENTKVPEHYLVGPDGMGYQLTYESFVHARVPTTMAIVAGAEKCLEAGIEHVKQRRAFGRPLAGHEGIQFELAEDYANVLSARWLCYRAAWLVDRYHAGRASFYDAMMAASCAKLVASESCMKAISDVLEWFGGMGTTTDYDVQQAFRTTRQAIVAEGTRNAQKIVIALQLLGSDFAAWRKWEEAGK